MTIPLDYKTFMVKYLFFFILLSCSCKKVIKDNSELCNTPVPFSCEVSQDQNKMNGVSLVSINAPLDSSHFRPIVNVNASWTAIIPFGFIRSNSSTVEYSTSGQWYGETKQGTIEYIAAAKQQGLKILLKPHLWIWDKWVGDLNFDNETDWNNFENTYRAYILDFARIADSLQVEAFCVGVELKQVVKNKPNLWNRLIDSVRAVYTGEITYAANWDNYQYVTFWNKLDFIGIDAYFPVSQEKTPTIESCYNGWENDFNKLKQLNNTTEKPIAFTEYGYRNVDFTGKEPWDDNNNTTYNNDAQINAYKGLFCKFWNESWFKGGFLWKWFPNHSSAGGDNNNRFTPQNKPVENFIKEIYGKTK